jgi:hypothetical protein
MRRWGEGGREGLEWEGGGGWEYGAFLTEL